jgi:GGDEF domain-containing protein
MIRKWVSELFGFGQEINNLRQRIAELSWDNTFGMWTRPAFLEFCRVMPRGGRVVALIDLNHIHDLNYQYGYAEVDRRIKATFAIPFRRSDIVARWYSGDEIVILFDADQTGAERKIGELRESAGRAGLTFVFAIGEWEVGRQPIIEVITALSQRLAQEKLVNPSTTLQEPAEHENPHYFRRRPAHRLVDPPPV